MFSNWGRWWHETDQEAIAAAREAGNTIIPMSDADREGWCERLQPVIDTYLAENADMPAESAKALYADILSAVDSCQ